MINKHHFLTVYNYLSPVHYKSDLLKNSDVFQGIPAYGNDPITLNNHYCVGDHSAGDHIKDPICPQDYRLFCIQKVPEKQNDRTNSSQCRKSKPLHIFLLKEWDLFQEKWFRMYEIIKL